MSRLSFLFPLSPIGRACRAGALLTAGLALTGGASAANGPVTDIVPNERLSQWLQRQPASADAYPTGLRWDVPEEVAAQQALKLRLTEQLGRLRADKTPNGTALAKWLRDLPVTGRARVANPDSRWLEVNPDQDPVLRDGQKVQLPRRPTTTTVVLDDGALCQVPYRAAVLALDYLRACTPDADQRELVWIAQPDGRSERYGIAHWNAQDQQPPAAGAWIWAPARYSGIPESFSDDFIKLLAAQGPAQDGAGRPVGAPPESQRTVSTARSRDLPLTASDWGEIGLLQTPTARMAPAGSVRFTVSQVQPYTRGTVMFQPLDWLEGGFRYSDVSNVLYDPTLTIASQSFKDKSVDAKVRLLQEGKYQPAVAIGARDLGGTGLFSGEYLVANKRTGDFDWSLGLGWGYTGGRGNLRNPLSVISDEFNNRPTDNAGFGGTVGKAYFRGPTSLFGGVQWQTPIEPLVLKLEYDGNAYKREPFANPIRQASPFNVGAVYRYSQALDISAGIERGNRAMVGFTLHGALDKLTASKVFDPPVPAVNLQAPANDPEWVATVNELQRQTGWSIESLSRQGGTLYVRLDNTGPRYSADRLDKLVAVLNRDAPASITRFSVHFTNSGISLGSKEINRRDWIALHNEGLSPEQRRQRNGAFLTGPLQATAARGMVGTAAWTNESQTLRTSFGPSVWQSLGGPDSFLLYQIGVQGSFAYKLAQRTLLYGSANLRLIDNYDKFKYTADSELPRVRTFTREYAVTSRFTISNLQLTHTEQLGDSHFAMVYGGLLEPMFGGVGGEYLYRPRSSAFAFGVDVNRVRQREFQQKFGFRDYEVNTGHGTMYWDTGWQNVNAKVSVGQYLAGDRGVTLDLSRRFSNGVTVGAWATKTNVSAAQFGEGSFDKGIYVTFPFDAILPRSSNTNGTIVWQPLTRDGGARLGRAQTLYGITEQRSNAAFELAPAPAPGRAARQRTGDEL